jgi:hypothetical protein
MSAYVLQVDHARLVKEHEAKIKDYDARFIAMQEAIDSLVGRFLCPNHATKTTLRESTSRLAADDANASTELHIFSRGGATASSVLPPREINQSEIVDKIVLLAGPSR